MLVDEEIVINYAKKDLQLSALKIALEQAQGRARHYEATTISLQKEINALKTSSSWRLTAPMRGCIKYMRNFSLAALARKFARILKKRSKVVKVKVPDIPTEAEFYLTRYAQRSVFNDKKFP